MEEIKNFQIPQLGEMIEQIMEVKKPQGWTQGTLADLIGATPSQVSKMKTGPDWKQHFPIILRFYVILRNEGLFRLPSDEPCKTPTGEHPTAHDLLLYGKHVIEKLRRLLTIEERQELDALVHVATERGLFLPEEIKIPSSKGKKKQRSV